VQIDISKYKMTNWKERPKTVLSGGSTIRRRMTALDCRGGGGGEEEAGE
jgi:hypothetical protein